MLNHLYFLSSSKVEGEASSIQMVVTRTFVHMSEAEQGSERTKEIRSTVGMATQTVLRSGLT